MPILGIDTGGTFTDFFLFGKEDPAHTPSINTHKVLSTPDAPERAILQGIREMGLETAMRQGTLFIIHGTTVATNAALENKGVKTVYITNTGLEDVLTIGRQTRADLYDLTPSSQPIPVPKALCLGLNTRCDAQGELLEPLSDAAIEQLVSNVKALQPQAIVINLLFSFLRNDEEVRLEQALKTVAFTSRSSAVLPEYKEYERGIATWLNASLGPLVARYLQQLHSKVSPTPISMMQSNGDISSLASAANNAAQLLLSGPAGGLTGAAYIAKQMQLGQLITFDMGGTSTDVALIQDSIKLSSESKIGPYPVAIPMVDMHTIGAGGGSIAAIDAGGLLSVGPDSAGANPGPACYGKTPSGTALLATVTDANVVLGRLHPNYFLGGKMPLNKAAAEYAIEPIAKQLNCSVAEAALGIIDLTNEQMTRALRVISVERGHDPKQFNLCCFGGAGGMHVCALADQLGITRATIPIHAGVLSALGMTVAKPQKHLVSAFPSPLTTDSNTAHKLIQRYTQLLVNAKKQLEQEGINSDDGKISVSYSMDLRYTGQSHYLNLLVTKQNTQLNEAQLVIEDLNQAFHRLHKSRFGHRMKAAIDIVNLRLTANTENKHSIELPDWPVDQAAKPINHSLVYLSTQGNEGDTDVIENNDCKSKGREFTESTVTKSTYISVPIYQRTGLSAGQEINGPALIVETVATTWLANNWRAMMDKKGNLQLKRQNEETQN